jgi:hypothetical protein
LVQSFDCSLPVVDAIDLLVLLRCQADVHRTKAQVTEEMSRLEAIVSKYKMTRADMDGSQVSLSSPFAEAHFLVMFAALIAWRHGTGY